ncbi:MAG: hypothetical protein BRD43_04290 [Bacteroidetes bacterium QS_4_64_154]|nr:MAG: hypothetical protein BRD43_04290 [Bacteroidetes bacterium QS_4_64_154]
MFLERLQPSTERFIDDHGFFQIKRWVAELKDMGSPVLCIGCSKMIVRICFLLGLRVHDCVGNDALAIDRGTTGTKNGEWRFGAA